MVKMFKLIFNIDVIVLICFRNDYFDQTSHPFHFSEKGGKCVLKVKFSVSPMKYYNRYRINQSKHNIISSANSFNDLYLQYFTHLITTKSHITFDKIFSNQIICHLSVTRVIFQRRKSLIYIKNVIIGNNSHSIVMTIPTFCIL
jgi:AraC-like DNA-binding protein